MTETKTLARIDIDVKRDGEIGIDYFYNSKAIEIFRTIAANTDDKVSAEFLLRIADLLQWGKENGMTSTIKYVGDNFK